MFMLYSVHVLRMYWHQLTLQILTIFSCAQDCIAGLWVVHKGLTCWKIYVFPNKTLKVAECSVIESGSCHGVYPAELPKHWMALKSLIDQLYSTASDVWSLYWTRDHGTYVIQKFTILGTYLVQKFTILNKELRIAKLSHNVHCWLELWLRIHTLFIFASSFATTNGLESSEMGMIGFLSGKLNIFLT